MKLRNKELGLRAREALRACFAGVPFLKVQGIRIESGRSESRPDLLVKLALPKKEKVLVAEIRSNGQPRVAREAVNQLVRYRESCPEAYGVFIAPYISPRAAEICLKDGVGYLDLSGNCQLAFDQVYIRREGQPNRFAEKRDLRSLYSPKAARVLRVLLLHPKKVWKVQDLAKEASVSLGQASNVKRLLLDREWIDVAEDGFSLSQPEPLLNEWAENYTYRKNEVREFYSLKSVAEIEAELAELCKQENIRYALTGFSGAARFAPTVRYQRVMMYMEYNGENLLSQLDLKAVPSGANVTIFTPYDEGVFCGASDIEGIQVASPVQIYLDLVSFRGRGEEAAKALLDEVIKPRW